MAASRPRHVARTRRCDVLEDAGLARETKRWKYCAASDLRMSSAELRNV